MLLITCLKQTIELYIHPYLCTQAKTRRRAILMTFHNLGPTSVGAPTTTKPNYLTVGTVTPRVFYLLLWFNKSIKPIVAGRRMRHNE